MKIRKILVFTFVAATSGFAQNDSGAVPEKQPISFQVLNTRKIDLGDRSLILNRVAPAVLPPLPPSPPTREPTATELAEEKRRADKKQELLFLSLTVYDHRVTEIRRFDGENRSYRVFSNIDFNHFAGLGHVETEDTVYTLMLGIGNETIAAATDGWTKQVPRPETFSSTRSEYLLVEDQAPAALRAEDAAALDALHLYYDANKPRLSEEYVKREAARAERERWLKEHPPAPQDSVINYWRGLEGPGTRPLDKRSIKGLHP